MIKTIKIGDQEVTLNNNIGWCFEYRDQFGKDIVPTMMPIITGLVTAVGRIIEETGRTDEITLADLAGIASSGGFTDAMVYISQTELTDFIRITWAMAKCADESIPEPKRWVRQFEDFPLDEIIPAVSEMIFTGVISRKNGARLGEALKTLQPIKKTETAEAGAE